MDEAVGEADLDPRHVTAVLDAIPGAYQRAIDSLLNARAGSSVTLDEF